LMNFKTHIGIPCHYVPGISFFAYSDSVLYADLKAANDLPLVR
jgi:hypothetical protein